MRKWIAVSLGAALAASLAGRLFATVIPPIGLAPGSQYQLIFVTADPHNATSSDIDIYNQFVSQEASFSSELPPDATTWNAVASTDTTDANVNAPSGTYPVYNTAGQLVADAGVGIYTGVLQHLVAYDQFGNLATEAQDNNVWTGSDYTGTGIAGNTLGGFGDAEIGQFALDGTWLQFTTAVKISEVAFSRPFYALSTALTLPAPEPSSIVLGLFAMAGLTAVAIRKRRTR